MGLRFRKSITLGKGVRLNLGKTGMSVSAGVSGFRKTINTKGQVTTSVGIPGSGIYYIDTKKIGASRTNRTSNQRESWQNQTAYEIDDTVQYEIDNAVEVYLTGNSNSEESVQILPQYNFVEAIDMADDRKNGISEEDIEKIYAVCDDAIDWTELLVSASAGDMFMEQETWSYLKGISKRILSGDIDAYLEVIETMCPINDLLDYGSEFEFGTENSKEMEVEFRVNKEILPYESAIGKCEYERILKKYVNSCSIRVARDMFALLPIKFITVQAMDRNQELLNVRFDKNLMAKINFREESDEEIIGRFL